MQIVGDGRVPEAQVKASGTLLALGVLFLGLTVSLFVLLRPPLPARAQTNSSPNPPSGTATERPSLPSVAQLASPPGTSNASSPSPATLPTRMADAPADQSPEINTALDQLRQARENLAQASEVQRKTLVACAIFLGVFALIAVAVIVQVYLQARGWSRKSAAAVEQVEAIATELRPLKDAKGEIRRTLPQLLQEVGDHPLNFEEEGMPFSPRALTVLDDIDHLAYLGDARLVFHDLPSPSEAAVYLNGLLLSAVAHLARSQPWTAMARLNQFLELLARYPSAVDQHRMAQAYSYRAQAAYQALDVQELEPSWLRRSERSQIESLSKQGFADVAQANRLDPDWKHATFVEAELCSRFYLPDDQSESVSRAELFVRGLRRAVNLYKELIEEKVYRGPARRNLARCLKRIAEQTGEKGDFSEFGYALSAFPTDEELADEALAARQPASQDRFLWQWLLGDPELFRSVDRLNLAEYRSYWIRLLDNKVHLRNWRADLSELQQRSPAMRDWSVQLLHIEPPISLANALSRRQERFDAPPSGA
jgi:hypothetical protein